MVIRGTNIYFVEPLAIAASNAELRLPTLKLRNPTRKKTYTLEHGLTTLTGV